MGQFSNFLRFFQAKSVVPRGRHDVIVGDVTSRLPAERLGVARNLQAKFGTNRTVSEFSAIFLKQNPRFYHAAVTSSSVTLHRAYPQNDSGVARNLHATFGADRTVPEFSTIF
jgi:hypothetical protein